MTIERILVGADGSPGSQRAVLWAAELAAALGARVVVAHVFEPLARLAELSPQSDLGALRERTARELGPLLCRALAERGVPYETRLVEGQPARALADLAEELDADLIVVAARRRTPVASLVLGSTSSRLSGLTRRTVVLVHPEEP